MDKVFAQLLAVGDLQVSVPNRTTTPAPESISARASLILRGEAGTPHCTRARGWL